MLDSVLAEHFARVALGHVIREYPNKLDHVIGHAGDALSPRVLHPVFYGSFDWHSAVHGHWLLARLYRRFPEIPKARDIRALFDQQFTPDRIAGEIAYLERPFARGFERPYGWAWLLKLAAELHRHGSPEGARWLSALKPLATKFAEKFRDFLPLAIYPMRAGVHSNTAFAVLLAIDYAKSAADEALERSCVGSALDWYANDENYRSLEPSLDEFLSPSLTEAACMQAVLGPDAFRDWLGRFLPDLERGEPRALFTPAQVSDRTDGKIAHLDGLNLSRAWCWRLLAEGLGEHHPIFRSGVETAKKHFATALPHISGDYVGEHWLASFALLALDPGR